MRHDEQEAFIDRVVADAEQIELADTIGSSRRAHDFGEANAADAEIALARAEAERLIQEPTVLDRLCPALRSVSDDLSTIAKTVGTALLPLALTPAAIVPLSTLVMGAVAVVVARAGIAKICPRAVESKGGK